MFVLHLRRCSLSLHYYCLQTNTPRHSSALCISKIDCHLHSIEDLFQTLLVLFGFQPGLHQQLLFCSNQIEVEGTHGEILENGIHPSPHPFRASVWQQIQLPSDQRTANELNSPP